jgi:hypothetical protein
MEAQPVDDLVDCLALGTERDSDEVEILRSDAGAGTRSRTRPGTARRLPGRSSGDPADQKSGHVGLLPHGEVVPEDDGDLRVELHLHVVALAASLRMPRASDLVLEPREASTGASTLVRN